MQLNIKKNQSIKLLNNLHNLTEEKSYYKKHRIRFPADLLNEKIKKVNLSLTELLSKIDIYEGFDNGEFEKTIFDYVKYLDDLNDSLLQIMKALTPFKNDYEDIKDVDKWLKEYNSEKYTMFKDATFADNDFIRISSNNIKHGNVRITTLELVNHKYKKVRGFYFSDILDENELFGPKPEIHKHYKNTMTAFSFNHFLLRTAGVVALNFYWLNKIIFKKEKAKINNDHNCIMHSFFSKFKDIEEEFFPDEYRVKYAKIVQNHTHITIMYQRYLKNEKFDDIKSIMPTFKFNGNKKSNEKIPYLSLRYSKKI